MICTRVDEFNLECNTLLFLIGDLNEIKDLNDLESSAH